MSTPAWHQGYLMAVDTETTGIDVHSDRIVTASVIHLKPGTRPRTLSWVVNPGVDIPTQASDVHGWTNERIAAHRDHRGKALEPSVALFEIAGQVALAISQGVPLIAFNASYDLSIIEAECARHGVPTLTERLGPQGVRGVVDPQVIEKQYDTYRKTCYKAPGCDPATKHHECGGCRGGKTKCGGCGATDRTLASLAQHYGVLHTGAHDAAGDALAAVRVATRLAAAWPEIARWKLPTLHGHQATWRREQSDSLRSFWRRTGDERWREVCGEWPLHTACSGASKAVA